ncbi:MAG: hypothetical protein HRU20_19320 [Pseudomonadales bacterium]|nr:hypothetical protein [Pseudomonadales bacterium]
MFKNLSRPFSLIPAAALTLMVGCSNIPHDEDSLYLHGFIAPLGQTALSQLPANSTLKITLKSGDTIIDEENLNSGEHWPTAYKLKFRPAKLDENENDAPLILQLHIQAEEGQNLVYQKTVQLDNPELFGSDWNVLVTPYSIEKQQSEGEATTNTKDAYKALFETYQCEDGNKEISIALNADYIVIQNALESIIPRTATSPEPVFMAANTRFQFDENRQFIYQSNNKESLCQLNDNSLHLWQALQEKVKIAEQKQIAADKKASKDK